VLVSYSLLHCRHTFSSFLGVKPIRLLFSQSSFVHEREKKSVLISNLVAEFDESRQIKASEVEYTRVYSVKNTKTSDGE
jgi:hypothetical protein